MSTFEPPSAGVQPAQHHRILANSASLEYLLAASLTWRHKGVSRTESGHRFALLLAGELVDGVVAEHRCNEPLCVRVDPGHVVASTQSANLRYAVACGRTGAIRNPDQHTNRYARSVAVRDALVSGWDARAYSCACGNAAPLDAPSLF